jgi:hypothetical protein
VGLSGAEPGDVLAYGCGFLVQRQAAGVLGTVQGAGGGIEFEALAHGGATQVETMISPLRDCTSDAFGHVEVWRTAWESQRLTTIRDGSGLRVAVGSI